MLKTYEVKLTQSDIEFIDDILDRFVPEHPTLHDEILGLRLTLNSVLTCEAGECDSPRKGLDTLCAHCAAVRDDARATYEGAKLAGWIPPTEFSQESSPLKSLWEVESEERELTNARSDYSR